MKESKKRKNWRRSLYRSWTRRRKRYVLQSRNLARSAARKRAEASDATSVSKSSSDGGGDDISLLEEKRLIGLRRQKAGSQSGNASSKQQGNYGGRDGNEKSVSALLPSDIVLREKKWIVTRSKRATGDRLATSLAANDDNSQYNSYPPEPASQPGVVRVQGSAPEQRGSIRIGSTDESPCQPVMNDTQNDLLIQAHMALDGEEDSNSKVLATATPDRWWRRHQWWLAGGGVILVVGIVLSVVLTAVDFGSGSTDAPSIHQLQCPIRWKMTPYA